MNFLQLQDNSDDDDDNLDSVETAVDIDLVMDSKSSNRKKKKRTLPLSVLGIITNRKKRTLPPSVLGIKNNIISEKLKFPRDIKTFYARTKEECCRCCHIILSETLAGGDKLCVWGFDAEWRVTYKRGPQRPISLLQFSTSSVIILFHVHAFGIVDELKNVLCSEHVLKVGVNIVGDIRKLERDFPVTFENSPIKGAFDIRTLACHLGETKFPKSLQDIVGFLTKKELPKPPDVRCGNWETIPLSCAQISYAAIDAYSSWLVFDELIKRMNTCKDADARISGMSGLEPESTGDRNVFAEPLGSVALENKCLRYVINDILIPPKKINPEIPLPLAVSDILNVSAVMTKDEVQLATDQSRCNPSSEKNSLISVSHMMPIINADIFAIKIPISHMMPIIDTDIIEDANEVNV